MAYSNLGLKGYTIISGVLTAEECATLSSSLTQEALNLVFKRRGFPVDIEDSGNLLLFTQPALRVKRFGDSGKAAPWRNGNSRRPLLSKSDGMINIHYNQDQLRLITLNPKLFKETAKVYGTQNLVHLGPERFSIKAQGAPDMPQHIDSNLFDDKVNYEVRIQGLVCLEVGDDVPPRDSGTLCLYINLFFPLEKKGGTSTMPLSFRSTLRSTPGFSTGRSYREILRQLTSIGGSIKKDAESLRKSCRWSGNRWFLSLGIWYCGTNISPTAP